MKKEPCTIDKKTCKSCIWKKILIGFVIFGLGMVVGYYGFMWFTHGFDLHFLQIDSCLDAGGKWNQVSKICNK